MSSKKRLKLTDCSSSAEAAQVKSRKDAQRQDASCLECLSVDFALAKMPVPPELLEVILERI